MGIVQPYAGSVLLVPLGNDMEMWCGLEPGLPLQGVWFSSACGSSRCLPCGVSEEKDEGGDERGVRDHWGWGADGDSKKWKGMLIRPAASFLGPEGAFREDGRSTVCLSSAQLLWGWG